MKNILFRISTLLIISIICYLVYALLLYDDISDISIPNIIDYAHTLTFDKHILILGLLPIYIGVMIFGATWLGVYAGNKIQSLFSKGAKSKQFQRKHMFPKPQKID